MRSLLGLVMAGNQVICTRVRWIHYHSTHLPDAMSTYRGLQDLCHVRFKQQTSYRLNPEKSGENVVFERKRVLSGKICVDSG